MTKEPKPADIYVAERIREAREETGMSLAVMAGLLGVHFNQLSKYERCIDRITSGRLYDIATITGKPIGWFFPSGD